MTTTIKSLEELYSEASFKLGQLERRVEFLEEDLAGERTRREVAERECDDLRSRLAVAETESAVARGVQHATMPFRLFILRGRNRIEGPRYRTLPIAEIYGRRLIAKYPRTVIEIERDGRVLERIV